MYLILFTLIMFFFKFLHYRSNCLDYVSLYVLFPSQCDIDNYRIIRYSRVSVNGVNTMVMFVGCDDYILMKEHPNRISKIKLYQNMKISPSIRQKLKAVCAHIQYKPYSEKYNRTKQNFEKLSGRLIKK